MTRASAAAGRQRIGGAREALLQEGPAVAADAGSVAPFMSDRRSPENGRAAHAATAAHLFSYGGALDYRRALDMMCD